ncbi:MAG: site-2 protease family protein [Deltaproteobacteria bacterium]|nr:site-2 protease family protein [Deltaproteobacteria bacterium]
MHELPKLLEVMLTLVTLLLTIAVHEFAHAFAAYKLGDDTAARQGRLTLNPFVHADPLGTLLLPAVGTAAGSGYFGWGKPVPYLPVRLSRRFSMRAGEAIVAFAGPFSNLVMAILCGGLWVGLSRFGLLAPESPFYLLLSRLLPLNVSLFLFNLIPVPPLDGSKVFGWLIGPRSDRTLDSLANLGPLAFLPVIFFGGGIIGPFARDLTMAIIRAFSALLA